MNKHYSQKLKSRKMRHYKNLFRILLSILILYQLLCCFSACQQSTSPNETNDDDDNVSKEVNSDLVVDSEKAYLYVKEAWDNSAAYTGAYTMKYSCKYSEDGETDIETQKISIDPQRKTFFAEYKEGDYSSYEKIIPTVFDSYHYYDGKNFYFMTDPQADYQIFEKYKFQDVYLEGEMTDALPNLSLADTLSELRAAYNEVISDACNSPESEILNATAKIASSVEKETYSLSIEMLIDMKDGTKAPWKIEIFAQDNMLVRIHFFGEGDYDGGIEEHIEYSYTFDQIGYNAIDVPAQSATNQYDIRKKINFYFKNSTVPVTENSTYYGTNTIEATYDEMLNHSNFDLDNYTWYTDPQLTKPFDPTLISDEEWFALENLYTGEYTGNWIRIEYQHRHDVNEAYGIVMGVEPYSSYGAMGASRLGDIYYTEMLHSRDENKDIEIYINGIKQAKGSQYFVADGSQAVYHVEFVYKTTWLGW